jgi:hypothetical protein
MVGRVSETAGATVGLRSSSCSGRGQDTDAPHNTEIKPRIAKTRITRFACITEPDP